MEFFKKIDLMIGQIIERLQDENEYIICLTGDHTTPCIIGDHTY